jgi:DNA-binding NarL/FixJ family response regulator
MVVERIRLVDVLAMLSLTTDLATGFPFERGLRGIGCGHASENAALFGDDIAFERFLVTFDPGDQAVAAAQLAAFEAVVGAAATHRFVAVAPTVGPVAVRASCEVAVALRAQLGLPAGVLDAFNDVFERWDGHGLPSGRAGEELHQIARVLAVADQAAIAHAIGGGAAARAEIARRAGGHLDPFACDAFLADADEVLGRIDAAEDLVAAVREAEPAPVLSIAPADLERTCLALATFADLKGTHLIGHSPHVTELAVSAAAHAGLDGAEELRLSALLHDLGEDRPHRQAVPLEQAAGLIQAEAVAGRLDPEMVAAVIAAAGGQRPRTAWPNDLTDREVEVLRLAARGLSNKEIATLTASSPICPRTSRGM